MGTRAAYYCRVSTDEQAHEGYSIAAQERACLAYCEQHGWSDVKAFVDEGKSAHSDVIASRPAFRNLLAAVEQRQVDVVVVHKFDRFSRSMAVTIEAFRRFSLVNCGFVSITEQFDYTTPQGRLFLHMLAALADFYSLSLSQETRKGKTERRAQGLYNGLLPFGVTKGPDGIPIPHPTNHAGLLLAFTLAGEGHSDRVVAQRLNAAGYRTSGNHGANLWTKDSVRPMLRNRFYLGELPGGITGKHAPLLDAETFARAQETRDRLRTSRVARLRPQATTYALSGLLNCGYCDGHINIAAQHNTIRAYCYNRNQGVTCPQRSVPASLYEAQIGDWLATLTLREDAFTEAIARYEREVKADTGKDERKALQARLDNIKQLFMWGDLSADAYQIQRDEVKTLLAQVTPPIIRRESLSRLAETIANVGKVWQDFEPAERNELLNLLVEKITVRDGEVTEITLRPPAVWLLPGVATSRSSGGDGHCVPLSVKRYVASRVAIGQDLSLQIADAAMVTSISATARAYGVARQTVRKAMRAG